MASSFVCSCSCRGVLCPPQPAHRRIARSGLSCSMAVLRRSSGVAPIPEHHADQLHVAKCAEVVPFEQGAWERTYQALLCARRASPPAPHGAHQAQGSVKAGAVSVQGRRSLSCTRRQRRHTASTSSTHISVTKGKPAAEKHPPPAPTSREQDSSSRRTRRQRR